MKRSAIGEIHYFNISEKAGLKYLFIRLIIGYTLVAATVPYILLKIVWLSGGTLGMNDPQFFNENGFVIGNAVTLAMDAFAIFLALALTHRWGEKLPAGIVLFPVWTATGLLAPILVIMIFSPLVFGQIEAADSPLQSWVFAMVYGGFAVQGVLLLTAFIFYVRNRWTHLRFGQNVATFPRAAILRERLLISCGAGLALILIVFYFFWLSGVKTGLPKGILELPSGAFYLTLIVHAGFTVLAAIGAIFLSRSISRGFITLPSLILVWIGAGALFGWGSWEFFIALGNPAFSSFAASLISLTKIIAAIFIIAPTAVLIVRHNRIQ